MFELMFILFCFVTKPHIQLQEIPDAHNYSVKFSRQAEKMIVRSFVFFDIHMSSMCRVGCTAVFKYT